MDIWTLGVHCFVNIMARRGFAFCSGKRVPVFILLLIITPPGTPFRSTPAHYLPDPTLAVQNHFLCNGFSNSSSSPTEANCMGAGSSCGGCSDPCSSGTCPACFPFLANQIDTLLNRGGGVSLALCFTELLGIWAAWQYRKGTKRATTVHREFF